MRDEFVNQGAPAGKRTVIQDLLEYARQIERFERRRCPASSSANSRSQNAIVAASSARSIPAARQVFDAAIVGPAVKDSFVKLHPRTMVRNPVMFVVEVGSVLTTILFVRDFGSSTARDNLFAGLITIWLWFTVLFANFAEAMAEGRGKAQAATLRRTRAETVATVPRCTGCPPPMPTRVGVTSDGPVVAWVDTAAGAVNVSSRQGDDWAATEVAGGVSGQGLDMAVDADGNPLLTFFDDDGGVQLARQSGSGWSLTKIADAQPADPEGVGNLAPTTSIAVDDEGAMVAAWDDADGVILATSDDGETFTPLETLDTIGGRAPSVGVSPDGSNVYMAWYDAEGDFLEVRFSDAAGYERETNHDAVMERVDEAGNVIGFSILGVSKFGPERPIEADLSPA